MIEFQEPYHEVLFGSIKIFQKNTLAFLYLIRVQKNFIKKIDCNYCPDNFIKSIIKEILNRGRFFLKHVRSCAANKVEINSLQILVHSEPLSAYIDK